MEGPGAGLPNIPLPRTPPSPPGLNRMGSQTVEQVTSKAWRWFNTTSSFFKLIMFPVHLHDLLCSTTPTVVLPKWLESGGSAKTSCQNLFRSLTNLDFQLLYLTGQISETMKWVQSQLQRLADGCHELALRLTKLEILVFNLDSVIESLQDQIRWLPQRDVRPKSQPKQRARPKPSSILPPAHNSFRKRVQRSFMKRVRTHESRIKSIEENSTNFEKSSKRTKQMAKRIQELEDQLEKSTHRMSRLMVSMRNAEKCLRENGLLRDDQHLSQSSSSEME